MTTKRTIPTMAERRAAALDRVDQYDTSAVDYFTVHKRGAARTNTHRLPQVRVTEDLARRLGDFGNNRSLSCSEAVRVLLALGLQKAEEHDDGDHSD